MQGLLTVGWKQPSTNSTPCIEVSAVSVVAVILAGGTSRRMGEDKATMYGGVERLQSMPSRSRC